MNRTTYSSVRTLLEDRRGKFLPMLAEYTSYYDMLTAHKKNIQNDNTKLLRKLQ